MTRRFIDLSIFADGQVSTSFMLFGDRVRMGGG